MNIVGRSHELKELKKCLDSDKPEFLAVYGRRRVGKTYLIREFFGNHFLFSLTGAANATMAQQLALFDEAMEEYGGVKTNVENWFDAFKKLRMLISNTRTNKKKVVFIDELPWLATPKSDFLTALEHFWNSWGSAQPDLLLIICGSATSWIIENIINSHGGLHNRLTRQLSLAPFSLNDVEAFFKEKGITLNRFQIIETYMVIGGIPYYLDYFEDGLSPAQNIDNLFFAEAAPLRNEFANLYASLFRRPQNHLKVIDALYDKKSGLTRDEIVKATGIASGETLSKTLAELEQCAFTRRYREFTSKKNGYHHQLVDFFTLFYLKFIRDKQDVNDNFWQEMTQKAGYGSWAGLAFERVCMMHAKQIKASLGIAGVNTSISVWRSKASKPGAQIDLVIDRADDIVDICEMKFSRKEYSLGAGEAEALHRRVEVFREETKTRKSLHQVLITTYGLSNDSNKSTLQKLVTMDDLFEPC